jgi:hypothetical protein
MTPRIPESLSTLFVTMFGSASLRETPTTTTMLMLTRTRTTTTRTTTSRRSSENLTNRLLDGSPQGLFRL